MKYTGREKEYRREWWAKNKEKKRTYYQKQRDNGNRYARHLMKKYGLIPEEWKELCRNGCGICGTTEDLVVDHNHKTGKVRGALCRTCNSAIGLLKENPDSLRRAIRWLEER